ncbi:hypothetical protein GCM10023166_28420 [Paeniglutamicibacter cryotolerans]
MGQLQGFERQRFVPGVHLRGFSGTPDDDGHPWKCGADDRIVGEIRAFPFRTVLATSGRYAAPIDIAPSLRRSRGILWGAIAAKAPGRYWLRVFTRRPMP